MQINRAKKQIHTALKEVKLAGGINFNFYYSLCFICYQSESQGPINRTPNASVYESVKQSI